MASGCVLDRAMCPLPPLPSPSPSSSPHLPTPLHATLSCDVATTVKLVARPNMATPLMMSPRDSSASCTQGGGAGQGGEVR